MDFYILCVNHISNSSIINRWNLADELALRISELGMLASWFFVLLGSPADKAELEVADEILEINGKPLNNSSHAEVINHIHNVSNKSNKILPTSKIFINLLYKILNMPFPCFQLFI